MNQLQFEQISPQLRNIATGYARRYLARADDVDDAASDAMLRLWAVHDSLRDTAHASRLSAVVARNISIDMLRRQRLVSIDASEVPTSWLMRQQSNDATPESQLEWKEDEQWLRQRIEQLPPREIIQVMSLRQTERRTNEEIAAILGISKESVATVLSSARRKLFNQIKERNRK